MWIGLYQVDGKTLQFDGVPSQLVSSYNESNLRSGYVFLSPKVSGIRRIGTWIPNDDQFEIDGFLCEWLLDSQDLIVTASPSKPLEVLESFQMAQQKRREELEEKFLRGEGVEIFTATNGKQLKGKIRYVDNGIVSLRTDDFSVFDIPIERFSGESQKYINSLSNSEKPPFDLQISVSEAVVQELEVVRASIGYVTPPRSERMYERMKERSPELFSTKVFPSIEIAVGNTGIASTEELYAIARAELPGGKTFSTSNLFALNGNGSSHLNMKFPSYVVAEEQLDWESARILLAIYRDDQEIAAIQLRPAFNVESVK